MAGTHCKSKALNRFILLPDDVIFCRVKQIQTELGSQIISDFEEAFQGSGAKVSGLLSCQPRVTVTSCFVYKVIRDLESIDNLCINPIHRIGLIHK